MSKFWSFSLVAVFSLALAGCGGGASVSSAPAGSAAASASASAPASTSAAAKTGASPSSSGAAASGAVVGQKAPGPYTPNGTADATSGKADVQALDTLKWQPNTLTVSPGAKVTLSIKSGATAHDFLSPSLGVNTAVQLPGGKTQDVSFTAPSAPGTYQFWCSVPGHAEAGMVGEVIVK